MEHIKFCILGGGPSGLTFARELLNNGISSFILLEAENEPGGLCRSKIVDNAPLDIGGGHFLDVKNQTVLNFLFEDMPENEWQRFQRIAKINLRGQEIDHPLEANIWQFPLQDQIDFLESIAKAGSVNDQPEPTNFSDWIRWKLGDCIAEEYMTPYNEKIWSLPINQLGTYWLYKLPSVSFRETLRSCLERKPTGDLPAHGEFFYPKKYGYGEVWRRMGNRLGKRLRLNTKVTSIDVRNRVINGNIKADKIINTIPWTTWKDIGALPESLSSAVDNLLYTSVDIDYFATDIDSPAHWIYEPSPTKKYHRLLLRHNFCHNAPGHWTETNSKHSGKSSGFRQRNKFAYPVNTIAKPNSIKNILNWANSNHILPIGRWGLWEHMNSDVAVQQAMEAARHAATD